MSFDCEVLIAGAGPTGLILAIELVRRGVSVRLVDSAEKPFVGSRGKGLQPRTLEIFDHIGLAPKITARAMLYPRMRVHVGPLSFPMGSLGTSHRATAELPYPNMLMLPQWRTEEALRERLADLRRAPEYGTGLIGFTEETGGITAMLASGPSVRAKYLVGCDGGRSTVRSTAGIGLIGETLDNKERVVADVEIPGLDRGIWHNWPTLGGVIAISPLPEPDLFQIQAPATIDRDDALGGLKRATGHAISKIHWKSRFRHQTRMAESWRKGRVLLAGDAAHLHPPSGGQGLNTSIQDAWNLGWKLAAVLRGAPDALLDSYEEERMAVAANMLALTKQLHKTASTKRGDSTNQLDVTYRGRSLSKGEPHGNLGPGDRMPNLALQDGERIFDRLRSAVHGLSIDAGAAGPIVVRPDGYIAAIGSEPSPLLATIPFAQARLEEVAA